MRKAFCMPVLFGVAACAALPSFAQKSASDGVYGGYVGSNRQFQMEMESVRQRANLQRSLERNNGGETASAAATGVLVDVHIAFPAEQRGLANIQWVTLEPLDASTHTATALAIVDRSKNAIDASYSAKKDVQPGRYQVLVEDARGGKYPIGEVNVARSRAASRLELSAPLLGGSQAASSSHSGRSDSDKRTEPAASGTAVGPGYVAPQVGSGYVRPQGGPGYIRPGAR